MKDGDFRNLQPGDVVITKRREAKVVALGAGLALYPHTFRIVQIEYMDTHAKQWKNARQLQRTSAI